MNPYYESTFVFPNDFPALLANVPEPGEILILYVCYYLRGEKYSIIIEI